MHKRRLLFSLVAGLVLFPRFTVAQSNVPVNSNATSGAPGSTAGNLRALGPEGEALAKRAGMWHATFTSWEKPGAPPVTVTGLMAERTMIGPMLEEVLHSAPGIPGRLLRGSTT